MGVFVDSDLNDSPAQAGRSLIYAQNATDLPLPKPRSPVADDRYCVGFRMPAFARALM